MSDETKEADEAAVADIVMSWPMVMLNPGLVVYVTCGYCGKTIMPIITSMAKFELGELTEKILIHIGDDHKPSHARLTDDGMEAEKS